MTKQLLYILILFLSIACNKSGIQEIEKLNIAYAKSFVCPFENVKVLVQDHVGVCGEMSKDEIANYYTPRFYKKHILKLINSKFQIEERNQAIIDSTKVYFTVMGHTENKVDTVFITENFSLNNKSIKIRKLATYKNDNWHIKTLKDENLY